MYELNMLDLRNIFFFSSRRRHTRFDCDWSSDVCSSDLKSVALFCAFFIARKLYSLRHGRKSPLDSAERCALYVYRDAQPNPIQWEPSTPETATPEGGDPPADGRGGGWGDEGPRLQRAGGPRSEPEGRRDR